MLKRMLRQLNQPSLVPSSGLQGAIERKIDMEVGCLVPFFFSEGFYFLYFMNLSYFPLRQFTEALSATPKVKVRLATFINELVNGNMEWTFQIFSELYHYMTLPDIDINFRFNSLVALKLILDTCQFPVVLIVQVYFLAQIRKIATYQAHMAEKQRGLDYFISQGYPKTEQIKKLGYNYVRLACEIVSMLSVVKPHKLYKKEELSIPSDFSNTFDIMRAQQWKEYDILAFYNENGMKVREQYLSKLSEFDEKGHKYYQFYKNYLEKILRKEFVPKGLDPKKILQSWEVYSCNFVLDVLKEMVLEKKATVTTNVLKLVTDFIKWGNIRAFYMIQIEQTFDFLLNMVRQPCDVKNLNRGQYVFQTLRASDQDKKLLYLQLMRSLQIWAVCIPKNLVNQELQSKCSLTYKEFIVHLGLQFPLANNIKKFKNECEDNLQKHKQINRMVMKELRSHDFELVNVRRSSGQLKELMRMDSNMLASLKSIITDAKLIRSRKNGRISRSNEDTGRTSAFAALKNNNHQANHLSQQPEVKKVQFADPYHVQNNRVLNNEDTKSQANSNTTYSKEDELPAIRERYSSENRLKTLGDSDSDDQEKFFSRDTDYSQDYEENTRAQIMKVLNSQIGIRKIEQKNRNIMSQNSPSPQKEESRSIQSSQSSKSSQSSQSRQSNSTEQSAKTHVQFFDDNFSSRSSITSKQNIIDQIPLIIVNNTLKNAKEKAHRTSTFKDISNTIENEENMFQMFKKIPTIKEYERLQQKVQYLQVEKEQLIKKLEIKEKQFEQLKIKSYVSNTSLKSKTHFSWSKCLLEDDESRKVESSQKIQKMKTQDCELLKPSLYQEHGEQLCKVGARKLLKNKDLLFRNDRIQIGFIFCEEQYSHELVLFLTPEKDLTEVEWSIMNVRGINIHQQSDKFDRISKKKQRKIVYAIEVFSPYLLPELKLQYSIDGHFHTEKILLPISYNKFVSFNPKTLIIPREDLIIRKTIMQMINTKLFKNADSFKDYFSGLCVKQISPQQTEVGGSVYIERKQFNFRFIIHNEDFVHIECEMSKSDLILEQNVQFLMITILNLIKK